MEILDLDEPSFIVTAQLDQESFRWLNDLRRRHFPAERNQLDAHLTLFHKLDETAIQHLKQTINMRAFNPITLRFTRPRKLGRGIAIEVVACELIALRSACAAALHGRLTPQDRQPYRPHVTIQNKVDPQIAEQLYVDLSTDFIEREGATHAILIWQYLGGPWKFAEAVPLAVKH